MATSPTQAIEVKGTLEVHPTDVVDRLKKIEEKLEAAQGKDSGKDKDKDKDIWDKLQASGASSLFSSLVLAFVGFILTGAISNSVQERQLELANIDKMQGLISDLANGLAKEADRNTRTTTLAAFGKPAIPAFISFLGQGDDNSLKIADQGLHMVGSGHPSWVCVHLTGILRNRSQLYPWRTFSHTLDLVGDLNCQSSMAAVEDFKAHTTTLDKLNAIVSTPAEQKEFQDLAAQTESILKRLKDAPKPSAWRSLKRFLKISDSEEPEIAG